MSFADGPCGDDGGSGDTGSEVSSQAGPSAAPSSPSDERYSHLVAKSASRIALYMMREDIRDSASPTLSGSSAAVGHGAGGSFSPAENPVQHSHDFFVISSCRVEVALKSEGGEESTGKGGGRTITLDKTPVPESLFPGSVDAARAILSRHGLDISGR